VSVSRIAEDDIETGVASDLDGEGSGPIPNRVPDDVTNEGDEGADG